MGRKLSCVILVVSMLVLAVASPAEAVVSDVEVSAPAVYLMDVTTGMELYAKAAHERRAPASMTKIVTLALVFDALADGAISLDDVVVASSRAQSMGGSQIYLEAGEEMTVEDLILAVAVSSANDASVALAEYVSGSVEAFVDEMNELASRLGLTESHFVNPHGLDDPDQYSSAHDISQFGRYLLARHPQVTEYSQVWDHWLRQDSDSPFWLTNTNRLIGQYHGMDGLKTGKTDGSLWCLSGTAERDGTRLIATVMAAPTSGERFDDVARLLDAGFAAVETVVLIDPGDAVTTVQVWEGQREHVALTAADPVTVTVPRGRKDEVAVRVLLDADDLVAPVTRDLAVGMIRAEMDGRTLGEFPLVPAEDVDRCSLWVLFVRLLHRLWFVR